MRTLHEAIFGFIAFLVTALVVVAAEPENNVAQPQQHGTTMMHGSPSDESDMSHTMHDSTVGDAIKKNTSDDAGEKHADHAMDAAQHDVSEHLHHGSMAAKSTVLTPGNLERLKQLPASGKSREANYDGTYYMHNTAYDQALAVRCALASRGLIMLDNESWNKCGGKPVGWSREITTSHSESDHSQHMNH